MADINTEAVSSLTNTLKALLPPDADASTAPVLLVVPLRVTPAGLGGYVGPHVDFPGDVVARRVEALAKVSVGARTLADLDARLAALTGALLASEAGALRERGILRLTLEEVGPQAADGPPDQVKRRELTLKVLYEYLHVPEDTEGIILEIPINLAAG